MRRVFIDNETMQILAALRKGDKPEESVFQELMTKLENIISDEMGQVLIETYLRSDIRVIMEFVKKDSIMKTGFYFMGDFIVMLNAYRDGGELMWLPTLHHLNGALAEMISDQVIQCGNEQIEGTFESYCTEDNCVEELLTNVSEEKYREVLQKVDDANPKLWMKSDNYFIYVVFAENSAFYYVQEDKKFYYGCADRPSIVNIMSRWMRKQHSNLIMQMQEE